MNPREIRLTEILRKYGVRTPYLFGSQQEAGSDFLQGREVKFDDKSDLDVGVVVIRPTEHMFEYKGVCRCFASGRPWAWRCVRTLAFPVASDERQWLLTFSRPDSPFRAAVIASFQGDVVRSVTLARFLRPFSCYGGSLSSKYAFRARFSHFSVSLTSPSGLKYITNVVKLADSSGGAEIRRVTESGFSLCVKECI